MYDFQKCTMFHLMLILNPQDLLQNRSLVTVPIWWSVNWLQNQYDTCTRNKCPELTYCPAVQDQCVLNDLEELGDKELLVLKNQYDIEIFSCYLRLLPFCSSTFHQTNIEKSQIRSEDNLFISRIQSLHLLLEVDDHDEEEYAIVLTLGKRQTNKCLAQYQSKIFHR